METLKNENYNQSSSIITIPLDLITKEMDHYDANFTDSYNKFLIKVKHLKEDDQAKVTVKVSPVPEDYPTRLVFKFVISKETDINKAIEDLS